MTAGYLLSFLSFAVFGKTLHFLLTRNKHAGDNESATDKRVNHVLFFPDSNYPCDKLIANLARGPGKQRACPNASCRKLHNRPGERPSSLIRFLEFLANAHQSIDLCIYLFTQGSLSDLLLDLKSRNGIHIRIITDSTEDDSQASQIERLRAGGIEIKSNKRGTGALMHHKFVVIDNKTLLSGSFNWTNKAVVSNYEAVIVSTEPSLVESFSEEFERLWNNFQRHPTRRGVVNHSR